MSNFGDPPILKPAPLSDTTTEVVHSPPTVSPTPAKPTPPAPDPAPSAKPSPATFADPLAPNTLRQRLLSLDVFRGVTIAAMLLVNNPARWGSTPYKPLLHADWHGWTLTDLIFPFFLFIIGVAIPFSLGKRRLRSEALLPPAATPTPPDWKQLAIGIGLRLGIIGAVVGAAALAWTIWGTHPRAAYAVWTIWRMLPYAAPLAIVVLLSFWKLPGLPRLTLLIAIIRRSVMLIALGWIMTWIPTTPTNGWHNPDFLRLFGVLPRIGLCYLIAAPVVLFMPRWWAVLHVAVLLCVAYTALMLRLPADPAGSVRVVKPDGSVAVEPRSDAWAGATLGKDRGPWSKWENVAGALDRRVFPLYKIPAATADAEPTYRSRNYQINPPQDPEGLLSTLPAAATVLFGVLAGFWLRSSREPLDKAAGLYTAGLLTVVAAFLIDKAGIPFNKNLWTPSYAVLSAGFGSLVLGFCYHLVDLKRFTAIAFPFKVLGMNAIVAFVLSGILNRAWTHLTWPVEGLPKGLTTQPYLVNKLEWAAREAAAAVPYGDFLAWPANVSLAYSLLYVSAFFLLCWVLYLCRVFVKV